MSHPEEGTIHAWLDGQLPADEASALEAHLATCSECRDAVAGARGLIASASRIVGALDVTPRGVTPATADGSADTNEPVTPPPGVTPLSATRSRRWQSRRAFAAAAVMALMASGALYLLPTSGSVRLAARESAQEFPVLADSAPTARDMASARMAPSAEGASAATASGMAAAEPPAVAGAPQAATAVALPAPAAPVMPPVAKMTERGSGVSGNVAANSAGAAATETREQSRVADARATMKIDTSLAVDTAAVRRIIERGDAAGAASAPPQTQAARRSDGVAAQAPAQAAPRAFAATAWQALLGCYVVVPAAAPVGSLALPARIRLTDSLVNTVASAPRWFVRDLVGTPARTDLEWHHRGDNIIAIQVHGARDASAVRVSVDSAGAPAGMPLLRRSTCTN